MEALLEALNTRRLVFDGAMGTALYERGLLYTSALDEAVLSRPDTVRQIHEEYRLAGADVLLTNTFGANRYRLAPHGLEEKADVINRAAAALAREAAQDHCWVVGSIGPTGRILKTLQKTEEREIRQAYCAQAASLCAADVDALLVETFRQPVEVRLALEGVREGCQSTCAVVASVSFDAFGTMADGTEPEAMAELLREWGADAIGVNCSDGPAGVYEMATRMLGAGLPVIAQPNAGLPRRVEGRLAYMATPEYFGLYARRLYKAGVRAVGGCCGTTVEHIKRIAAAARMVSGASEPPSGDSGGGMRDDTPRISLAAPGVTVVATEDKGALGAKLGREFVVSVEINPPPGLSLDKALRSAKALRDAGVTVINVADGPRASARMGNLALCYRIQETLSMPALLHVTTRDRNLLGLIAHLLAAHELGVRNLVVITGDPPKMGDFPDASAVYDTDSIGLLRITHGLNHGYDPGGKPMGAATSFFCATGAEPGARDYEREIARLRQKVAAGAELIMTQPVYDVEVLDRFLSDAKPLDVPILVGLLPLASHRNAEFLHNEVPGMSVPAPVRERMRRAGSGEAARAEGVAIAREMLKAVKNCVAGAYIMPPFGRYELAIQVLDGL